MDYKEPLWGFPKRLGPFQQALLVRMAADSRQVQDFRMDFNGFPKEPDFLCPGKQQVPKGPWHLVAHEQNRGIFPPKVMF